MILSLLAFHKWSWFPNIFPYYLLIQMHSCKRKCSANSEFSTSLISYIPRQEILVYPAIWHIDSGVCEEFMLFLLSLVPKWAQPSHFDDFYFCADVRYATGTSSPACCRILSISYYSYSRLTWWLSSFIFLWSFLSKCKLIDCSILWCEPDKAKNK